MVVPAVGRALAAGRDLVGGAVLVGAQVRAAPRNAFLEPGLAGIDAVLGAGRSSTGSLRERT